MKSNTQKAKERKEKKNKKEDLKIVLEFFGLLSVHVLYLKYLCQSVGRKLLQKRVLFPVLLRNRAGMDFNLAYKSI